MKKAECSKAMPNKRTTNYSSEECWRLVNLVSKYKHVVECKKTDATTWQENNSAWQELANKFNCGSTMPRTSEQLRSKFDTLKKETRKYCTKERQQYLATGGGPYIEIKKNPLFEKIKEIIKLSTEGLPSRFDSDSLDGQQLSSPPPSQSTPMVVPVHELNNEFSIESGSLTHMPFSEHNNVIDVPVLSQVEESETIHSQSDHSGCVFNEDLAPAPINVHVPGPSCSTPKLSMSGIGTNWRSYSPAMLKRPKHPSLMVAIKKPTAPGSFRDESNTLDGEEPDLEIQHLLPHTADNELQSAEDESAVSATSKSARKTSTEAKGKKSSSSDASSAPWVARRRPSLNQTFPAMSGNGQRLGSWADARKKVAETQTLLLQKEFDAREARETELHEQMLHIYKLKMLNLKLDIKLKRKALGKCVCGKSDEESQLSDDENQPE